MTKNIPNFIIRSVGHVQSWEQKAAGLFVIAFATDVAEAVIAIHQQQGVAIDDGEGCHKELSKTNKRDKKRASLDAGELFFYFYNALLVCWIDGLCVRARE